VGGLLHPTAGVGTCIVVHRHTADNNATTAYAAARATTGAWGYAVWESPPRSPPASASAPPQHVACFTAFVMQHVVYASDPCPFPVLGTLDVYRVGHGSNFADVTHGPLVVPMACACLRRP
jgi:hypothetical protein